MIQSEPLFHLDVEVGDIVTLGAAPYGERRVVAITGGRLSGNGYEGVVLSGGADWQILRADGVLDIEARYAVQMADGGIFEVLSQGYRHGPKEVIERMMRGEPVDPDEYFFRAFMRFQTGSPALLHLNRTMAVARGARKPALVSLDVEQIV